MTRKLVAKFDGRCSSFIRWDRQWFCRDSWIRICRSLLSCAHGVVVIMFDFHRNDRGSYPGRGGKIS